jgi:hypothetical protein
LRCALPHVRVTRFSSLQLADRLAELPYRVLSSPRATISTWTVTASERARVQIFWPRTYQWVHAAGFTISVKRSFERLGVLRLGNIPQHHRGVVRVLCTVDGHSHMLAIDYSDRPDSINHQALEECSLYVKFQYRERGYQDNRIIAGGYPVAQLGYYHYYRAFRDRHSLRPSIDVLGRFGLEFQRELRAKAVEVLSSARDIRYVGAGPRVRYSRFLREAASARIGLDLPGNGPFTYRIAEFLGLGTCLIAPRYSTALHASLEPGVHYVQIADDLSDLLSVCRYYLAHERERAAIAKAGRDFFDRYLHSDHLAAYYLRALLDRVGNAGSSVELPKGATLDQNGAFGVLERDARYW